MGPSTDGPRTRVPGPPPVRLRTLLRRPHPAVVPRSLEATVPMPLSIVVPAPVRGPAPAELVGTRPGRVRPALPALALALFVAIGAAACDPLPPLPSAPPGGVAPDCNDVAWGSGAKHAERMSSAEIARVRASGHRCFDRLVVDLRTPPAAGWHVRYHAVTSPGSGATVPLRGGAALEVVALAPAYGPSGASAFRPANRFELADVSTFRTFRQLAYAGTFEGQTTFGIGVRSRLPFRVFAVTGPSGTKLVIDVAHRWP